MPERTAPETVALIRALAAQEVEKIDIAARAGVHLSTVERYLQESPYPPPLRHRETRKPLYDPGRDGLPDMPLTARLCGDPLPGRRELVARHMGRLDRSNVVTLPTPSRPR